MRTVHYSDPTLRDLDSSRIDWDAVDDLVFDDSEIENANNPDEAEYEADTWERAVEIGEQLECLGREPVIGQQGGTWYVRVVY